MDTLAYDRVSETPEFTNQFVVFPTHPGCESLREKLPGRLSRGELDAFSTTECDNARGAQFFIPPAEPPEVTAEKGQAAGVLKQAAHDERRFHAATTGVKRELYLDAYSWITANDFSWSYSFVNVCKLLDVCPEVIRTELLADASLGSFGYWIKRGGRLSQALRASIIRVFARWRNPKGAEVGRLAKVFEGI
jgi:hypothetical protein